MMTDDGSERSGTQILGTFGDDHSRGPKFKTISFLGELVTTTKILNSTQLLIFQALKYFVEINIFLVICSIC